MTPAVVFDQDRSVVRKLVGMRPLRLARGPDGRWTVRHRLRLEPTARADQHPGLRVDRRAHPRHGAAGDREACRAAQWKETARGQYARLPAELGGGGLERCVGQPDAGAVLRPQQLARPADARAASVHQRRHVREHRQVQYQWQQGNDPPCCPTGIGTGPVPARRDGKLKALDPVPNPGAQLIRTRRPYVRRTIGDAPSWSRSAPVCSSASGMCSGCSISAYRSCSGMPNPSTSVSA